MNPWIETIGVVALALGGAWLGRWFSRLPKLYWMLGYFLPFLPIIGIGLTRWFASLEFTAPFSWLVAGRQEFAVCAFATTLLLTTPFSRLTTHRLKVLVVLFMAGVFIQYSLLPFLGPALIRNQLAALKTTVDADGVCLQSTSYNCGPAAAVTALRRLGLPAEEGELAVLAHTCNAAGTPSDVLADTLNARYGNRGLASEYRLFKSLSELKGDGITIAVIKYSFWADHYVTVLEVTGERVTVGDPLKGKASYTHDEFKKIWRFTGVVLKRNPKA